MNLNRCTSFYKRSNIISKTTDKLNMEYIGDFNTALSPMGRISGKKLHQQTLELHDTINHMGLTYLQNIPLKQ